jgi:hypothetical protein
MSDNQGRLNNSTAYLVGAMDYANDHGAGWRKELTPWLENLGVEVLNPCEKPFDVGKEDYDSRIKRDIAKKNGDYETLSKVMKEIRIYDLNMVDASTFIIFYLDYDIRTTGSYEEIFWANRMMRPVIIVCKQGKEAISDWLFGTFKHHEMFGSMEEAKEYLMKINDPANEIDKKRWKFRTKTNKNSTQANP